MGSQRRLIDEWTERAEGGAGNWGSAGVEVGRLLPARPPPPLAARWRCCSGGRHRRRRRRSRSIKLVGREASSLLSAGHALLLILLLVVLLTSKPVDLAVEQPPTELSLPATPPPTAQATTTTTTNSVINSVSNKNNNNSNNNNKYRQLIVDHHPAAAASPLIRQTFGPAVLEEHENKSHDGGDAAAANNIDGAYHHHHQQQQQHRNHHHRRRHRHHDNQSANQSNPTEASSSGPAELGRTATAAAVAAAAQGSPNKCSLTEPPQLQASSAAPASASPAPSSSGGGGRSKRYASQTVAVADDDGGAEQQETPSRRRRERRRRRLIDAAAAAAASVDGDSLNVASGSLAADTLNGAPAAGQVVGQPSGGDYDDDNDVGATSATVATAAANTEAFHLAGDSGDQIISYNNLIGPEDDDLFLERGSRRHSEAPADDDARRSKTSNQDALAAYPPLGATSHLRGGASGDSVARGRRSSLEAVDEKQVQTIYFGGFFPWLTDEEEKPPATMATPTMPEEAAGASDGRPSPLINGRQQQQQQQQAQQQKQRRRKLHNHNYKQQQQQANDNASVTATSATTLSAAAPLSPPLTSASSYTSANRHQLGRFILPAVRLALDHINTNASVLSYYKLEIVPRDTQCNATISLKEFFDMVYEEPKKMLLYGDACRVSTDPIAKASYFFDLIQISYADTDPIYTIENYPNFFRVVPSENALSLARIPFIRHFNWTRVGTIYQNLPRYSLPHSKLLTDLERFNIVIKQSVSLPGSVDGLQNRDLGDELRKLKEKDVRIILGNFDEEWALLLFCEAFREKMTGRKYQWILTGVSEDKLWQFYKRRGSSCSEQELLVAMDGYIITDITPVTRSQHRTISGMMAHEYSNEYKRRAQEMNIAFEENKFYGYVYDGIWAIALALHRVDYQLKYYNRLAETGKGFKLNPEIEGLSSLLDFDYHRPIWVKLIRHALNKTRFSGVTGTVSFHKNERPGLISFSQFQAFRDTNEVIIGSYDALNDELDLNVGFPIFWRGPSPPIDYTIQRVTPFRINRILFVIISILALCGIVLAFIFLTVNIKFRNQRYIKMSSPYLNNLIIIGCILTYTSVIILGLDSGLTSEYNFPYICNARAWVLMAGFTLAFGSMFSKTFRVHSIFTNIKLHKKVIKDYKLFMVVFILLTLDVSILACWQYFDPFYRETNNGISIQDSDNEDVIIVPEMEHCQSKRMTIFLSVIYVYKGLLMAFGCFLAWETRHVSIPALNDSKYIGLSVYNVVIMCVIGASLSFVLRDQQDASFVIISIFIIFCSTTTLCLVFVPKVRMLIELKQNPRAGDHRVRATLKTFKKNYHEEAFGTAASCRDIHGNIIGRGYGVNLNERIKILFEENVKQRSVLKEKTYELEALTYKYRKIQSMVQTGQYLQALNATAGATSSSGATTVGLAPGPSPSSSSVNLPSKALLLPAIRPTPREQVSFPGLLPLGHEDKARMSIHRLPEIAEIPDGSGGANVNKFGSLIKSPLMSSATQITTTNTTSSTNNATDLTSDYSSSKVLSNVTSSTSGCQTNSAKRTLVAFDCTRGDHRTKPADQNEHTLSRPVAVNYSQNLISATQDSKQAMMILSSSTKPDPKIPSSQDDLNLFTVFSYIANENNIQGRSRHKRQARTTMAENSFSRWSTGPFCTLMVKNGGQLATATRASNQSNLHAPGKAIMKGKPTTTTTTGSSSKQHQQPTADRPQDNETRASCPDITASKTSDEVRAQLRRPRRQLSQQTENSKPKTLTPGLNRGRLPRTMSMIEYLGLNEFDLIARRHDKLLRRKLGRNRQMLQQACCYDTTSSCVCCASGSRPQHSRAAHNTSCHMQSEGDIVFSSSDLLNSADLIQSSSRLSCSICCSLASPSYGESHSDIFDETTTRTSQSGSSETVTSTGSESLAQHGRYMADSRSSTESSSIIEQGNSQPASRYCQHHHHAHAYAGNHSHQHHPHYHPNSSEAMSTASSSSSLYPNPQSKPEAKDNEQSLCTTGALYCAPASKEGANDAAQPAQHASVSAASGGDVASISNTTVNDELTTEDEDPQQKLLIKCDVLESL